MNTELNRDDVLELLIDGHHGIYIPQIFASAYADNFKGYNADDRRILEHGPEHAEYWDAWDMVLTSAYYETDDGRTMQLFQYDGDLWSVDFDNAPTDFIE